MEKRKEMWRALPFVMALLLLTLVPAQSASALFGKSKEEVKAADGAPVAENMEIKVYRGVALSTRRAASWGRTASPTRRSTPTATPRCPRR